MENEINSCLMLATNIDLPVDLWCIFDEADLKDTGIEYDTHITLLYAQSKVIPREGLLQDINAEIVDWSKKSAVHNLLDLFYLDCFENDSDYVVLKLKESTPFFKPLQETNARLKEKYGVSSEFNTYTPHMTLAELNPGTARKYMESQALHNILEDSFVSFEDLMISYGPSNTPADRKQYFLTHYSCVDRFFRLKKH